VCVRVRTCMCMNAQACMCMYTQACMCACMQGDACVYTHIHTHVSIDMYARMRTGMCVRTCVLTYVCAYNMCPNNMRVCTCVYIDLRACMHACVRACVRFRACVLHCVLRGTRAGNWRNGRDGHECGGQRLAVPARGRVGAHGGRGTEAREQLRGHLYCRHHAAHASVVLPCT